MIRDPDFAQAAPQWVGDILARWARVRGAEVALAREGQHHSWADLEEARIAWSARLASLGVRPGDRVMVVGENCPAMVMLVFAIVSLRAWVVNVNARLSAREIDVIRAHSGARLVVFLTGLSPDAAAHARRCGATSTDAGPWDAMELSAIAACEPETVTGDPAEDVAALLYTTGTTGEPKAVMLTHANLLFIARNSGELRRIVPGDRVYGLLPVSHVYGLASVTLGTLLAGGSIHLQPRFSAAGAAQFIRREKLTVCQGVPAMYAKLIDYLKEKGEASFDAPQLRFLYAGGSPLVPALKREVERIFGLRLHNGYGLTEASPTLTQTRHDAPRDDCSVGPPIPGVRLRIVDPEGRDLPEGEVGELWALGPNVMKGYYKDPPATAAAIKPGGWLATGDLARRDPDGAIHIEGRLKELIIRSGFNVFPVEVEAVLNAHPAVSQSAVVGRSRDGEEEVIAFVELAPGARAEPAELIEFAARSLAPYKRPSEIVIMASLPAAASGKVLKGKLAQMARELRPESAE
jgi:acyl-CoA synthetase (AMP-forming)/AMP-acid ligase II